MSRIQIITKNNLVRNYTPQPKTGGDLAFEKLFLKLRTSDDRFPGRIDILKKAVFSKYQNTNKVKAIRSKAYFLDSDPLMNSSTRIETCFTGQCLLGQNSISNKPLIVKERRKKEPNVEITENQQGYKFNIIHSEKDLTYLDQAQKANSSIKPRISQGAQTSAKGFIIRKRQQPKVQLQHVSQNKVVFYERFNVELYQQKCDVPMLGSIEAVSAEAYGVYHCHQGKMRTLLTCKARKSMEVASLTKTMTAVLVLSISRKFNINLTQEKLKVGHKAAILKGTTASLMYGDILTVYDALHGLMLPSGNDAAQALAQWGGKKIRQQCNKYLRKTFNSIGKAKTPPLKLVNFVDKNEQIPYSSLFIFHMNQMAKMLKMTHTKFNNPHGLMNRNNYSCVYDITLLSHYAMEKFSEFRSLVQTRSYSTKIMNKVIGNEREVTWKNTHKLLKVPHFKGIKTGNTPSAGPCLSSCFSLGPNEYLLVILLKAKSQEHRFIQTKKIIVSTLKMLHRQDLLHCVDPLILQKKELQSPGKRSTAENQITEANYFTEENNNVQLSQSFNQYSESGSQGQINC